jgi:hypothetical protein
LDPSFGQHSYFISLITLGGKVKQNFQKGSFSCLDPVLPWLLWLSVLLLSAIMVREFFIGGKKNE